MSCFRAGDVRRGNAKNAESEPKQTKKVVSKRRQRRQRGNKTVATAIIRKQSRKREKHQVRQYKYIICCLLPLYLLNLNI